MIAKKPLKSFEDVLKQDVDSVSRKLTRDKLEISYLKALELPDFDELETTVPEQVIATAESIEKELYKEYNTQPKEYIKHLAKLQLFLDPKHYVGQFSKMFRIKTLQNVYTPDRLIRLDITDMLPEVFLNPKANPASKLDIYQNINRLITNKANQLQEEYNFIHDPSSRRPTKPHPIQFDRVDKLIKKHHVDVKDLCENPYWKMKKVNMIICKEDKKFYCLDIEQLLTEIAEKNIASNYFTKKILSQEIIDNLRNRYAAEITEIKQFGEPVEVGSRTDKEILDLKQTIKRLEEFRHVFNQGTVLTTIELFGLNSVEDPTVGGVKDILNNIPVMIQEEFEDILDEKKFEDAVEQINLWLDANIDELKMITKESGEEFEEEEIKKAEQPSGVAEAEKQLINEEVLKPNTVASKVYNSYVDRLKIAHQTVLEELKRTKDLNTRSKLNDHLQEINTQLKEVRTLGQSIEGIITLLKSSLNIKNNTLESIPETGGMNLLYPQQMENIQEKTTLEEFIKKLQTEIAYLEELHASFVEEQK